MQISLSLFKNLRDLLIPLRCVKCGLIVGDKEGLCPSCWPHIPFIIKPYCACCGFPFEFDIDEEALCGACNYERPLYETARSVFAYTAESKDLILKFKHMDALSSVPIFSQWMVRSFGQLGDALCVPVPLHWTRLFTRTYNQAALLGREISRLAGWSYAPSLLIRKRRTPSQGYLSKKDRIKNVERAFHVPEAKKGLLAGKTVVLVDDVFTTGATLNACTKVLLKAGASEVHALTLGRVVKPQQIA